MKVRMLTSVGGVLGGHESPSAGEVIDIPESLAKIWADGDRAEYVDPPKKRKEDDEIETASLAAPEQAVRPRGRPRKVAR